VCLTALRRVKKESHHVRVSASVEMQKVKGAFN
jgi:hypothetical protein